MATATWTTITVDDLDDCIVAAQMAAVREAALGDSQDDPFGDIMPVITARVRAELQRNPINNVSSIANSVPPSLKNQTCWMIIAAMQPRIPGLRLTDDQLALIKDARDYVKRVGMVGGIPIEQPDDVAEDTMQKTGGVELAENSTLRLSGNKQEGLYL